MERRQSQSIFDGLITSKTRVRILMRLFLNPGQQAYLRELAGEFGLSPSLVGEELRHLTGAGLLAAERNGRQVHYQANTAHALFPELHSMVRKALGMNQILESIIQRLGDLDQALLVDDYAEGKDTGIIDLVLIGHIDRGNLDDLVRKTERHVGRKIRPLTLTPEEFHAMGAVFDSRPRLELWRRHSGAVAG